jgi:hypothetical protein
MTTPDDNTPENKTPDQNTETKVLDTAVRKLIGSLVLLSPPRTARVLKYLNIF